MPGDSGGDGAAPGLPYHCQQAGPGAYRSRYAGAMLTHAFTSAIGAAGILQAGCGLSGADAAADLAVLNATAMGFTLGALTLEQTKHLQAGGRRAADRDDAAAGSARLAAAPRRDR